MTVGGASARASSSAEPSSRWFERTPWAGIALLLVYVALAFLADPRGMLGTDTGIKVATLKTMEERGSLTPDIGYWAAAWDPEATAHAFRDTRQVGDGYVDVTTLPMVYAALPLWLAGGYRATLLLPMAGAVGAAFVARGIARRLRPASGGWAAFWLAGLASPLAIYALDLWEHTLGVALMGAGVLLLIDVVWPLSDRGDSWRGLVAGGCFGLAYTMRTEALVYTAVSFAVSLAAVVVRRRSWGRALVAGAAGIVGFGAVAATNVVLEIAAVGQTIRSSRAGATAAEVGTAAMERVREGIATLTGLFPTFEPLRVAMGVIAGALLVAGSGLAVRGRDPRRARPCIVAAGVILLVRAVSGLGFWPGLLVTTPVAATGLARGWGEPRRRLVALCAVAAVPLVLAFQYRGGALPQWGGRYLLVSGFLLAAVGAVALGELDRWVRHAIVGIAVTVTVLGVAWLVVRTHQVASAIEPLRSRGEDVLIWTDGFLPREFAAMYGEQRWLASPSGPDELDQAIAVARRASPRSIAIVLRGAAGEPDVPAPVIPGYRVTGHDEVRYLDPLHLDITSYTADDQ